MKNAASSRIRRWTNLVAACALLAMLALGPAAGAAETGQVNVNASVTNQALTFTICDGTADFGSGLSSTGATPTGTTDSVAATSQGTNPGEGVVYVWTPDCQAAGTGKLLHIESNRSWSIFWCATENSGTNPNLEVAEGDLRVRGGVGGSSGATTYADGLNTQAFQDCGVGANGLANQPAGTHDLDRYFFLRVDDADADGTFASTTIWTVSQ